MQGAVIAIDGHNAGESGGEVSFDQVLLVSNDNGDVTAGTPFVSGAKVMFGGQSLSTKFVSATELTATGTATTAQKGMSVQVTVANPDPGTMTSAA